MNYQTELENILKDVSESCHIPSLLLHSCCGPCSSYVVTYLMEYFDITVFFYNPNIFPVSEYYHRLYEQKRFIDEINSRDVFEFFVNEKKRTVKKRENVKLLYGQYHHPDFTEYVKGLESEPENGKRCEKCFELRLKKTADTAKKNNFDFFGTTLSVSPHKDAALLNKIGKMYEPPVFLVSDFKKKDGYKISVEISSMLNLYRQNYCGCEFAMRP